VGEPVMFEVQFDDLIVQLRYIVDAVLVEEVEELVNVGCPGGCGGFDRRERVYLMYCSPSSVSDVVVVPAYACATILAMSFIIKSTPFSTLVNISHKH